MEGIKAHYSFSIQNHVPDMADCRIGPGFDRKVNAPFQAIIEKGKQAKAQDEHDQYEARKVKREMEIKNAARIRHAEAEANRRRAEESKLSIDDHKGKLLDDLTKNIKAILEQQYQEEIRAKVYEDEDRIVSAYEHDIKDQTRARLVRELESVIKAKLGAEFEPEIRQQLAVELEPVVKAELGAKYETEVKQQLVRDLGPRVETGLRAKYETEVKQQLAEELQSGVKAELRARFEEEIKNQLMIGPEPTIPSKQKEAEGNAVETESQRQGNSLQTLQEELHRASPNDSDNEGGEYPDLSHHQHFVNQNGVPNGQQETRSAQTFGNFDNNGDAVALPHGTKRSLSDSEDEEEDPYARQPKRSRSGSFSGNGQPLPDGSEKSVDNLYSRELHIHQSYPAVQYSGEDGQGFVQYEEDADYEVTHNTNEDHVNREASGYNNFDVFQGDHENIIGRGEVDYNSSEDIPGFNGSLLDREGAQYGSVQSVQGTNGDLLDHEEAEFESDQDDQERNDTFSNRNGPNNDSAEDIVAEDYREINGTSLSGEQADYDSTDDVQGSDGYNVAGEATETYSSDEEEEDEFEEEEDEEDEEDYQSGEEEDYYSTAPQAATHAGNGVIAFTNTQDTAFVLSDSEDDAETAGDEDKTLVGYQMPEALINAKYHEMPAEESLFLNTEAA